MKLICSLFAVLLVLQIAGCVREGTYPITGQECSPDDPVQRLDASDCVPPG